ncbi:penicillin-binding protein activator, partial [Thioclava sp. BHET1]
PVNMGNAPVSRGKAVKVALLVPANSSQAGDGLLARGIENAARLAIADLNGVAIDMKVYPTDGTAATAATAATQAADDGAQIILGPVYSQAAAAAGQAVAGRGIDVLAFSNNTAVAGGNVFLLGPTFQNTADRLVQFAASRGKTRLAVVHDRTAAGKVGFEAIQQAASAYGASVVDESSFPFSQQGVSSAAPGIAQSVTASNADAVFFTSDTAGALPLITQLLTENGVSTAQSQFIGLTRWDIPPSTLTLPGVQNGWFAEPDPTLVGQFSARYRAAYGAAPSSIAGLGYDGIAAIGALVQAGKALNASGLTQANGFVGVNGIFRFLPNGTNQRGLAVAQITNNQVSVIDPAPRSFGGGAGF